MIGIIRNTNAEYHSGAGVSISGLKLLQKSPLHYWSAYIDPKREERKQTPAMATGSAIHAAALEPHEFAKNYEPLPGEVDRRTKEGKAIFSAIESEGKIALTSAQHKAICSAAYSVRRHPIVAYLLAFGGMVEHSIYWIDKETGALLRARPDYMIAPCDAFPNGLILDLKSSENASTEAFSKSAYSYGYHLQAPWYMDGFQSHFKTDGPPPFVFAVVEKEAPFASAVYAVSDYEFFIGNDRLPETPEFLAVGRQTNAELLEIYAECLKSGDWPGYQTKASPLVLPAWAEKKFYDDEQLEVAYV